MTTQPRPTAEEIAALFGKHGVKPGTRFLFPVWMRDEPRPQCACALGILAFDTLGADGAREFPFFVMEALKDRFSAAWVNGVAAGFDGNSAESGGPEYAEGYATGQAVRRLVGLEAGV